MTRFISEGFPKVLRFLERKTEPTSSNGFAMHTHPNLFRYYSSSNVRTTNVHTVPFPLPTILKWETWLNKGASQVSSRYGDSD